MHPVSTILASWYQINQRNLPWRENKLPYEIWLSEIIFQQTRINQGLPYYKAFIQAYPTLHDFAQASEDEILKLWQGLGYYSRARNMLKAAKMVANSPSRTFPESYDELLKLPGIGPYTAAAIASIAFNQNKAVIDGNVNRLLSRLFNVSEPIDSSQGQKIISTLAYELLPKKHPGNHNQAMMEFGSLQCKPGKPNCAQCDLQPHCLSHRMDTVAQRPVKAPKTARTKRILNYLVIVNAHGNTYIEKRHKSGIWHNLYQFPLIEAKQDETDFYKMLNTGIYLDQDFVKIQQIRKTKCYRHLLSHQDLSIYFWLVGVDSFQMRPKSNTFEVSFDKILKDLAIPIIIKRFLDDEAEGLGIQ
ncbi:MAG: A/G-specific adenine glycosylase [Bacteroidia bacterium]|jgi:A/G-specific adenine glycosylase